MDEQRADSEAPDGDARRTIARLAVDTVPRLIERLMRSELGELEVREDGWRIRLRRASGVSAVARASTQDARDRGRRSTPAGASGHSDRAGSQRGGSAVRSDSDRGLVSSPAVGYFIPREGVSVGTHVGKDDVIGQVDMLGVSQEVVAGVEGTIARFEVESGQAIEFGQPVARVRIHGTRVATGPAEPDEPVMGQLVEA